MTLFSEHFRKKKKPTWKEALADFLGRRTPLEKPEEDEKPKRERGLLVFDPSGSMDPDVLRNIATDQAINEELAWFFGSPDGSSSPEDLEEEGFVLLTDGFEPEDEDRDE